MNRKNAMIGFLAFFLAVSYAVPQEKKLLQAMDILRFASVELSGFSPDGQWVLFTQTATDVKENKSSTHIWRAAVKTAEMQRMTFGEKDCRNPKWSPDGRKIAFVSDRDKDNQIYLMWADGGEAWKLTGHKGGIDDFFWFPDGKRILFLATEQPAETEEKKKKDKDDAYLFEQEFKRTQMWIFDIEKTEEKCLLEKESFTCAEPAISPDGKRIVFTARFSNLIDDQVKSDLFLVRADGGGLKKVLENPGPDASPRWSPDGRWISFTGHNVPANPIQNTLLQVIGAEGGAPRDVLKDYDNDVWNYRWHPDGKRIYFISGDRTTFGLFIAEVETGKRAKLSTSRENVDSFDVASDGKTIAFVKSPPQHPVDIWLADDEGKTPLRLTDVSPWLKEYTLGEVEVVRWKSPDGKDIEGVLTKPVNFDPAKKYPLLLNPHGGPSGASTVGFNAHLQIFAANGYLILEPNFRGSSSYGQRFKTANVADWGKGDYQDCISGVDELIKKGIADPERLGVIGWSYGGYMTFWIITQTNRFKAAAPGAGLSNIISMYGQNDIPSYLGWYFKGTPWMNETIYWSSSPMKYIKNVKTPTLIMQGESDRRVPPAQAYEYYRALKEMGRDVTLVFYPREGHEISEANHRVDQMRRWLFFFGKHLNNPPLTEKGVDPKNYL